MPESAGNGATGFEEMLEFGHVLSVHEPPPSVEYQAGAELPEPTATHSVVPDGQEMALTVLGTDPCVAKVELDQVDPLDVV